MNSLPGDPWLRQGISVGTCLQLALTSVRCDIGRGKPELKADMMFQKCLQAALYALLKMEAILINTTVCQLLTSVS